jgi:hypothetical protein
MTPEEIAECFREALNMPLVLDEPDVRHGVALAARKVAAGYTLSGDEFSAGCFLQSCGL